MSCRFKYLAESSMWKTRTSSWSYWPMRDLAPTERVQLVSSFRQLSRPLFKSYSRLGRLLPPLTHTDTPTETPTYFKLFCFPIFINWQRKADTVSTAKTIHTICNSQSAVIPGTKMQTVHNTANRNCQCWKMYKAVAKLILEQNTRW